MTRHRISLLLLGLGLLVALWLAPSFPFIVFIAILVAVALRALADPLSRITGLPEMAGILIVLVAVLGSLGAVFTFAAAPLAGQLDEFMQRLPSWMAGAEERMRAAGWSRWVLDQIPDDPANAFAPQELLRGGQSAARTALGLAGGLFGGLGSALFTLLLAIYFAIHPDTYLNGLRAFLAPGLRPGAEEILKESGHTLRYWLAGQLFSMAFIGGFVWFGLWFLGLPMAGFLALLAALLGFVPIVGPIVAAVPAVLLGASQGLDMAGWVIALYFALHIIEGDILTPLIQSHAVSLPPGMLLMSQLFLGMVFGLMGIAVAAPLAAIAIVATRRGYVRNWLEKPEGAEEPVRAIPAAPRRPATPSGLGLGPAAGD